MTSQMQIFQQILAFPPAKSWPHKCQNALQRQSRDLLQQQWSPTSKGLNIWSKMESLIKIPSTRQLLNKEGRVLCHSTRCRPTLPARSTIKVWVILTPRSNNDVYIISRVFIFTFDGTCIYSDQCQILDGVAKVMTMTTKGQRNPQFS